MGGNIEQRRIAGVVLAGGRSQRFGRDKAEQRYGDRKLIDWSIAALQPLVGTVFVSGRDYPPFVSVADRPEPGMGPLGGIAGAMAAAKAAGYTHLLSLPCDTPDVAPDQLAQLCKSPDSAYLAACPVIGLWPADQAEKLAEHLAGGGRRSVRAWADAQGAAAIDGDDIANINSVEDLERLSGR
ncbi:molybdopterin-guanine dinucleotide biosynthesis protein A [Sphingopyxis panaciterrae]|uniref:molybdenum cofactor guanylyltransferase n=1 Tax=Sphingopyxis panaciterrae TaxID=363841 RepID=UPI001420C354|nr:molybdenum cofactor guanylyltransferase [Sphingopyxis panaciterrae]NIJ36109.1 molybdopterin-guanine dinucleotide biosynthesis protein A [Sphingopyxis panaciterrae]